MSRGTICENFPFEKYNFFPIFRERFSDVERKFFNQVCQNRALHVQKKSSGLKKGIKKVQLYDLFRIVRGKTSVGLSKL